MVIGGSVFPEASLVDGKDVVGFQVPDKPVVNDSLERFAEAAGEGYRAVVVGI